MTPADDLCRQLREALELFQHQMLQVDRVRPDAYCYNVLISGCAHAGYSKMAFKLYTDVSSACRWRTALSLGAMW